MATPTSNTVPASSVVLSNNYFIDALIYGTKWGGQTGTAATVTFSFPGPVSSWSTNGTTGYGATTGTGEPWSALYSGLNASDQNATINALTSWANVAKVSFTQVADNATTVGEIRIAWSGLDPGAQAWAYAPGSAPISGDVWLNAGVAWDGNTPGTYGFMTIAHELGHALGLKHTFSPTAASGAVLPSSEDGYHFSLMSYSALEGYAGSSVSFNPTTPMLYDIAAMQYIYGANTAYHAGNDTYTFTQGQNYFQTIWDGGGTDTIVWSATTESAAIDLRGGRWSDLGNSLTFTDQYGNLIGNDNSTVAIYYTVTIENATGGGASDRIDGNGVGNALNGGAGNDVLYGYAGNDTFDWDPACRAGSDVCYGGTGNDVYVFNAAGDRAVEKAGEGTDILWVSCSYSLGVAANVESLYAIGSTGLVLTGNSANNAIGGSTGNDTLDGRAGIDNMSGGAGNDIYIVDNASDLTTELASSGTDTVKSTVSRILDANLEKLVLAGTAAINGTGNTLANTLTGNAAANNLKGMAGNDVLNAGAGNDILNGGVGKDTLTGGTGIDTFDFNALNESVVGTSRDVIADFVSGVDKIDLSGIDANTLVAGNQAFTLIASTAAFTAAGQVKCSSGILYCNVNGDAVADFQVALTGVTTLAQGDYVL